MKRREIKKPRAVDYDKETEHMEPRESPMDIIERVAREAETDLRSVWAAAGTVDQNAIDLIRNTAHQVKSLVSRSRSITPQRLERLLDRIRFLHFDPPPHFILPDEPDKVGPSVNSIASEEMDGERQLSRIDVTATGEISVNGGPDLIYAFPNRKFTDIEFVASGTFGEVFSAVMELPHPPATNAYQRFKRVRIPVCIKRILVDKDKHSSETDFNFRMRQWGPEVHEFSDGELGIVKVNGGRDYEGRFTYIITEKFDGSVLDFVTKGKPKFTLSTFKSLEIQGHIRDCTPILSAGIDLIASTITHDWFLFDVKMANAVYKINTVTHETKVRLIDFDPGFLKSKSDILDFKRATPSVAALGLSDKEFSECCAVILALQYLQGAQGRVPRDELAAALRQNPFFARILSNPRFTQNFNSFIGVFLAQPNGFPLAFNAPAHYNRVYGLITPDFVNEFLGPTEISPALISLWRYTHTPWEW